MLLLPFVVLSAFQDGALVHTDFAENAGGWTAAQLVGTGAEVEVVHDADSLKFGKGSLRLKYAIAPGNVGGAALPIADGTVAKMGSVRFWVRPDANAALIAMVQERGGGRFAAVFSAAKDRWQEVELGLADFVLGARTPDPEDANGRLDRDRIESFALVDLGTILSQTPGVAGILGIPEGPRSLLLSDFRIAAKPLPEPVVGAGGEVVLDDFSRPQAGWGVLNATADVVSEAPLSARALRLDYNLPSGKATVAYRPVRAGFLTGKKSLSVELAAKSRAQVIVQLEERGGGKYNAALTLDGGSPLRRSIPLAEMKPADDSKDDDGKLDPEEVTQVAVIDVTAMVEAPGRNTLWVGKIAAKP